MNAQGLTFNKIAKDYNQHRSAYPLDFIKMVLEVVPNQSISEICEIGCGSGQATVRLAELGYSITCVEPGSDLLQIARSELAHYPDISFIGSTFELADLRSETFDVVFAANSLHWVSAESRYNKSAAILKPMGSLVAVWRWNLPLDGILGEKINKIFAGSVPTMRFESRAEYEDGALSYFRELEKSGLFWKCQVRRYPYEWKKPSQDYVDWISTWSQLAALSGEEREDVCRHVKAAIDEAGGMITESGETVVIAGQKSLSNI